MRQKPKRLGIIALLLALAMIAAACGSETETSAAPETSSDTTSEPSQDAAADEETVADDEVASNVLRVGLQFGPDAGLAIETDDSSILVKAAVIEGLVDADATGQPQPGLATAWERIDANTWEFDLREGVVFHDGSAFDAAAVQTALNFISTVASPPRSLGGLTLTTEIIDELTVQIVTSEPDPILPLRLSSRPMGILAPAAYESTPTEPIGTGPFAVSDFTPPDSLTVERFDDYWGEVAQLDGAEFRFLPDAGARSAAIRAGEIDVADGIAIPDLEALEQDADVELIRFSLPRTASLYANTDNGPLANDAVREALSLAINETSIADDLLEGQFSAAAGYFGPENEWAPQRDIDPAGAVDEASAILDGLADDDRSITVWTYNSRPELPDIATVVQSQLQSAGFEVELEVADYTPLEERVFAGEHDLFLVSRGYYFDIADPGAVLSSDFTCEGGYNLSLHCDPEFDALVNELSLADSTDDRQALFAEAAQFLQDENIGFPLVHDNARYAARTNVEGLEIDPFETTILTTSVSLG